MDGKVLREKLAELERIIGREEAGRLLDQMTARARREGTIKESQAGGKATYKQSTATGFDAGFMNFIMGKGK